MKPPNKKDRITPEVKPIKKILMVLITSIQNLDSVIKFKESSTTTQIGGKNFDPNLDDADCHNTMPRKKLSNLTFKVSLPL